MIGLLATTAAWLLLVCIDESIHKFYTLPNELSSDQVGFLFTEDTWSAFGVVTNSYYVQNLKMNILFS